MPEDPQKKLEDILKEAGGGPAAPSKSLFSSMKKAAEAPPPPPEPEAPAAPAPAPAPAAPAFDSRIRELESRLAEVQQKAIEAAVRLQEKEKAQKEMEAMFQQLRAQQQQEQTLHSERELGAKMTGRVASLEERLDKQMAEMQQMWVKAINEMMTSQREALKGATGPEVAAIRGDLEILRKEVHSLQSVPPKLEGEQVRWEQSRQEGTHAMQGFAREINRIEETLKSALRVLEERQRRDEENGQAARLEGQAAAKHLETLAAQFTVLRGDLDTLKMVTRRVSAVEEAGVISSKRHDDLSGAADRLVVEVRAIMERLHAAEEAGASQGAGLHATAAQAAELMDRMKAAEENLHGVAAGVQAVETAAAQRLIALEGFAVQAGGSLEQFSAYANQLAQKMNEFAVSLQLHMDQTDSRAGAGEARAAAIEGRAAALAQEASALHQGLTGLSEGLGGLGQKLRALEETVSVRVGTIEAGWSGVALALPEEVMSKVRAELGQFKANVDASVETKVSGLDSSLGMLTRAIPEGILKKMREETGRLEARVNELKARIEGS